MFSDQDFEILSTEMSRPMNKDLPVTDNDLVRPTNTNLQHFKADDPQPVASPSNSPGLKSTWLPKPTVSPGPEVARPLPTLSTVTLTKTGKISNREKGKSRVLTCTPEKKQDRTEGC